MGDFTIGTKAVLSQSGSDEAVLSNTVTGDSLSCIKLYTTLDPNATSVDINGYFDDSVYAYYKLLVTNMHSSVTNATPYLKVMTSGSVDTGSHFWTTHHGIYGNAGAVTEQNRADSDGIAFSHLNCTWDLPSVASQQQNFEITFANPQDAVTSKLFNIVYWGDSHSASAVYYVSNMGIVQWRSATALTGISFTATSGNLEDGRVTLYGYKI